VVDAFDSTEAGAFASDATEEGIEFLISFHLLIYVVMMSEPRKYSIEQTLMVSSPGFEDAFFSANARMGFSSLLNTLDELMCSGGEHAKEKKNVPPGDTAARKQENHIAPNHLQREFLALKPNQSTTLRPASAARAILAACCCSSVQASAPNCCPMCRP
jgi:hypothetical protein